MLVGNLFGRRGLPEQFLETAVYVSHERRDTHDGSHGKDHDSEEDGIGETDRRQVRRTVMPHHNTIRETDQSRAELGEHDGKSDFEISLIIGHYFSKSIGHDTKSSAKIQFFLHISKKSSNFAAKL